MAEWFKRLPGFRRTPAGIERTVLRSLPKAWSYGSLLLMLPSLLVRLGGQAASEPGWTSTATTIDIWVVALIFLHWTVVLTVAIGAFIVMVMKGPAYVADAYPLDDAEAPDTNTTRRW